MSAAHGGDLADGGWVDVRCWARRGDEEVTGVGDLAVVMLMVRWLQQPEVMLVVVCWWWSTAKGGRRGWPTRAVLAKEEEVLPPVAALGMRRWLAEAQGRSERRREAGRGGWVSGYSGSRLWCRSVDTDTKRVDVYVKE